MPRFSLSRGISVWPSADGVAGRLLGLTILVNLGPHRPVPPCPSATVHNQSDGSLPAGRLAAGHCSDPRLRKRFGHRSVLHVRDRRRHGAPVRKCGHPSHRPTGRSRTRAEALRVISSLDDTRIVKPRKESGCRPRTGHTEIPRLNENLGIIRVTDESLEAGAPRPGRHVERVNDE